MRGAVMSGEFEDEYSATIDESLTKTDDLRESSDALLNDTIAALAPAQPLCLGETSTVHDAVRTMLAHRQAGVLITDGQGRLAGIFTERDVLTRVVAKGLDPAATPLSRVMTPNPDTISPDKPFGHALIMMYDHGYRHMPVVDGGKPVGIVSMRDAAPPELKDLEVDVKQREHISEILG